MALRWPAAAWLAMVAVPAAGHDFWIEPSTFRPEAPETVRLHLKVGDGFTGRAVRRRAASVLRYWALAPSGREVEAPAPEGMDPAGLLRVDEAGDWVVGYQSERSSTELSAGRFHEYLVHQGLEDVLDRRLELGQADEPGREVFSRCAKALLGANGAPSPADRILGLPLELVAATSPARGATAEIRLLYLGEPLAGAQVVARSADEPDRRLVARTDAGGRVRFTIDREAPWLITAVHMVPAPDGVDADWESFWASLTFRPAG